MKFLCDKCKTRYSIGDDRVRGKILKIRCKNCANIITVREGMDIAASEPRRNPTQAFQTVQLAEEHRAPVAAAAPQGALGAAFASQLSKPPPALEEEWYVSMDGNQEGPFTLAIAQRWVSMKPFEAELHCWSEGFDDWLPVDKVSHFRNLRKRPVHKPPTLPPPIPKLPPREEVKPLFAATLASIEKSAGVSAPEKPQLPHLSSPTLKGTGALSTKANGTGVAHAVVPTYRDDARTTVDSPVFNDETATTAEPVAARRAAAPVKPLLQDDDDDNLEIGEVSRVVKLADIAGMQTPKRTGSNPALRVGTGTSSNPRLEQIRNSTASMQKLTPSELGMSVDPALAALAPGAPMPDESIVARSFAQRHRRGMIVLLSVSALLLLGVIGAVVFFVSKEQGDLMDLGGTRQIDMERPEDIVRRQAGLPPTPKEGTTPVTPTKRRPSNNNFTQPVEDTGPETGPTSKLDASEVEAMAAKYGEGTKRCYMRAQKGVLGLEIADTKKIDVTLTVGKDGVVSDVQLSKHANNEFGQCLISRIKGWRFRESRGGTFRIALAFSAS